MLRSSEILCREATTDDVEPLAAIRALEWGDQAYWVRRIRGYMTGESNPREALPLRIVFVATRNDRPIGFIAGHRTRRFDCEGELQWINVVPDDRGSGTASRLLRMLAAWFAAHEIRRVCVDVDVDNPRARAFYRRHGAQPLRPSWLVWHDIGLVEPGP